MLSKKFLYNQMISRRTFLLTVWKIFLFSLLSGRMFLMQFFQRDKYKILSDKNRINLVLLPPTRGKIFDINGLLLAKNKYSFKLLIDININNNYINELEFVASVLDLSYQQLEAIKIRIKKSNSSFPIVILDHITWQQVSLIEEHKSSLDCIFVESFLIRFYPYSSYSCHVIGYLGPIGQHEKLEKQINHFVGDYNIGKSGIEKYYNNSLAGDFGCKHLEVNALGKKVREIANINSIPGNDLYLNLDIEIQKQIHPSLIKSGCSVIVSDINNGSVLVLATSPGFDSNNFSNLSLKYWKSLIENPYKPLLNKAIQCSYPPGSVFKIITIFAALEIGIPSNTTFNCTGASSILGTNSFRCHKHSGHGIVDMLNAIKYSCNTYIYQIAKLVGHRKILEMAKRFGFGKKTGIDLAGEINGFLPSEEWKIKKFRSNWTIGDTLNLSIGQGFVLCTPIQLARFITAIANNGFLYIPQVLKQKPMFEKVNIKQEYLDILKEGMYRAVNTPGGTGYYNDILSNKYKIAGKTGTVQVQSKINAYDDLSSRSILWNKRNHAVFIGFAPFKVPKYSVLVYVDHGGGGGRISMPIANKIMSIVMKKYIL